MNAADDMLLRWGPDGFRPAPEPGDLRAADSWLVADGRVRAFDAHERRFGRACGELGRFSREQTREFLLAAMARVPSRGRWFPRAELIDVAGGPRLQLRIRPAPPQGHSVRLWLSPSPDTRTNPLVKGPDLGWLASLRRAAVDAGADEAVLLSRGGHILEGSTTSILWWRGDTLCAPPDSGRVLPSVTRDLILDAADAARVTVSYRDASPAELAGLEVWAVNALHGIRPVTAWIGTGITAGPSHRALRWQVYLDELSREVRPGPAEAVRLSQRGPCPLFESPGQGGCPPPLAPRGGPRETASGPGGHLRRPGCGLDGPPATFTWTGCAAAHTLAEPPGRRRRRVRRRRAVGHVREQRRRHVGHVPAACQWHTGHVPAACRWHRPRSSR